MKTDITDGKPDIYTPEQVADYLQLPVAAVMQSLINREIPGFKIGSVWRIRRVLFEQWLDQLANASLPEPSALKQGNESSPNENQDKQSKPCEVVRDEQIVVSPGATSDQFVDITMQGKLNEMPGESGETHPPEDAPSPPTPDTSITPDRRSKRIQGTVKSFNIESGYGFIRSDDGKDVFVHAVDVEDYGQTLKSHHRVEFQIRRVPKGLQAYDVLIIGWSTKGAGIPISSTRNTSSTKSLRESPITSHGAQIAFERALAARELGDFKRARELFEEAIRKGPFFNVFQAYSAMEERNNPENAIRVLEKGIQFFPDAGILYNDYAMLKRRVGDLAGAIEILRRGLNAAPAFARQLHWSLAAVLVELDSTDDVISEAAEHARQAKELGQDLRNDWRYLKLQILTGPSIGKLTYRFFETSGFKVTAQAHNAQWADLLIQSDLPEYVETYDLRDRILVRCFYSPVSITLLTGLQNSLRATAFRSKGINQDVAFLVAEDISPLRDVLYRLMSDNREAIVPVDLPSLLEASKPDDPSRTLRPILDQWLSRRDLYRFNYPVYGRRFFGRELDLQRLMRDIDDGHNVGVFGLRKVGKTSLLMQLREIRPLDIVVYFDLQGVPSDVQDCAYIYWAVARKLKEEIQQKGENIPLSDLVFKLGSQNAPQFQKRTPRMFDHDLKAVLKRLAELDTSTRVILIIDEVDRLLPAPGYSPGFVGYPDFFAYLRGTSQNSNGQFVTIITAANPALCEQAMWEGRDNPIFQFYHLMFLPPLSQDDCNEMIVKLGKGMGISYSDDSLAVLFKATSGHPYLTRLLCSLMSHSNSNRPLQVTPAIVDDSRHEFLRGEATPIFNEILERLDAFFPVERDLLLFIADGVDDESELMDLVHQPVDVSLYHLVGYQLVERVNGKCRIKIDLLREWLRRYRLGRTE